MENIDRDQTLFWKRSVSRLSQITHPFFNIGLVPLTFLRTATTKSLAVFCWLVPSLCFLAVSSSGVAEAQLVPGMVMSGQPSVSATGDFKYSVPISVPPGTAGMAPSLSVDYSSSGKAGPLGLGWSLNGLPTIKRCAQTTAQDGVHGGVNYNADDRFCLNGSQRLIAISGTYGANNAEYRLEINDYTKIVSFGTSGTGPTYFKLWTRSGKIMEFGNTADSRVQPAGATVREWAVNKVTDTLGNYLTATYNSATGTDRTTNGEIYPTRIDYTGNGTTLSTYNSVQFAYVARNSAAVVPAYEAGYVQKPTVLLSDIRTYSGATLVSDYKLAYTMAISGAQSDELTSIKQCDGSATPICLPPITLSWQGTRDAVTYSTVASTISYLGGSSSHDVTGMDLNGDGLTDVVVNFQYDGTTYTPACPSSGGVFFGTVGGTFIPSGMTIDGNPACLYGPSSADINGDGLSDLLELRSDGNYRLSLNDGAGHLTFAGSVGSIHLTPTFEDLNGDSKLDYFKFNNTAGVTPYIGVGDGTFVQGANISNLATDAFVRTADFNGDGCSDLLAEEINATLDATLHFMCNPGVNNVTVAGIGSDQLRLGDFNGDGLQDFILLSSTPPRLYLGTGTGFVSYNMSVSAGIITGDWNGDGKTDIAQPISGTGLVVYLSTGTDFVQKAVLPYDYPVAVADWNSDGAADIWLHVVGATSDTEYLVNYTPEYVHTINNGLGVIITVTYDRLNKNGTLYTKGTGATYPVQDIDDSSYVVSQLAYPNGIGGTYVFNYSYAGKKNDVSGRGELGFTKVVRADAQSGVIQTTNYRTDFPYNGLLSSQTLKSGSVTLSSTTNTFGLTTLTGISSTHYYNVLPSQIAVSGSDLDGTALPSSTTAFTYDTYENPLTITQSVSDGSSSTTTNTFNNDTTLWILDELTSSSVTKVVP